MEKPAPEWKNSKAKKLLLEDLLSGDVDESMTAAEVFMLRPEYSLFKYANFVNNLRNLRVALKKKKDAAARGKLAFQNDRNVQPSLFNRTKLYWPESQASSSLKIDIESGRALIMTNKDLWLSRLEYQEFPYKSFYDHVRQELRTCTERAYWGFQKMKKKKDKAIL